MPTKSLIAPLLLKLVFLIRARVLLLAITINVGIDSAYGGGAFQKSEDAIKSWDKVVLLSKSVAAIPQGQLERFDLRIISKQAKKIAKPFGKIEIRPIKAILAEGKTNT